MNVLKAHVSLDVTNSESSYEKAFGVTATKRRPGYAKLDLESPSHIGIQVATTAGVVGAKARFESVGLASAE